MFGFLFGLVMGVFLLVGYGAYRAVNSEGWDDSNILNWLRLLSHVFIHPEDFGKMYYLPAGTIDEMNRSSLDFSKPFDYINKDEFAENFPDSRP